MVVLAYILVAVAAFVGPVSCGCGGEFRDAKGSITSPRYPKRYPFNLHCNYEFPACPNDRIFLDCKSNLENTTNCVNDYLKIDNMIYCGHASPKGMVFEGSFNIEFHTNNQIRRKGFSCSYERLSGAYTGQCNQGRADIPRQTCSSVVITSESNKNGIFATEVKEDLADWTIDLRFDNDVNAFEVESADVSNISPRSVSLTKRVENPGVAAGSELIHYFTYSYDADAGIPSVVSARLNGQELCQ